VAEVAVSVEIVRPAHEVFAFLADMGNDPRWREEVIAATCVSGEPGAEGAVYRERLVVGGRTIEVTAELVEVSPWERIVYQVREPVHARGGYTLAPTNSGTRVTFEVRFPASSILAEIRNRVIAAAIGGRAEANLRRLRSVLESAAAQAYEG
jgi:uncharacterized membrane protein